MRLNQWGERRWSPESVLTTDNLLNSVIFSPKRAAHPPGIQSPQPARPPQLQPPGVPKVTAAPTML